MTDIREILVTGAQPLPPAALELLRKHDLRVRPRPQDLDAEALHHALDGVTGYLIGGPEVATEAHFEQATALEVAAWVGTDFRGNVPGWRRAFDLGIAFVSTPGANAVAVAEFTVRLVLTLARPLPRSLDPDDPPRPGTELRGRTIGLIGVGRIGAHVARMATLGLGMRAVYAAPRRNEPLEAALGIRRVDLAELLVRSDVVSLHRPGPDGDEPPELGPDQLDQLREGALLVNTGHHDLVDPAALLGVIERRGVRAAFDGIGEGDAWRRLAALDRTRFLALRQMGYLTHEALDTALLRATEGVCAVLTDTESPLVNNPDYRDLRHR